MAVSVRGIGDGIKFVMTDLYRQNEQAAVGWREASRDVRNLPRPCEEGLSGFYGMS